MNDRETIAYFSSIADRPESWQRADWGSAEGQRARWRVIGDELSLRAAREATVLDVGCGDGGLRQEVPNDLHYTGWDLIGAAGVEQRDLFAPTSQRFDWVVASGLWTYRSVAWAEDAFSRMWALCRRGVIVNSLSTVGPDRPDGELALDPADFLAWGFALSPNVSLRHDYWPGDMTLVVVR